MVTLEDVSSGRAHRDSHQAGTTNDAVGASESGDAEIDDAVRAETTRFFRNNRWLSPLGNSAAAVVFLLTTRDFVDPDRSIPWFVAMVIAGIATAVASSALMSPSRSGIPAVAQAAYLASGLLWGLLLWLDPDARMDSEFRWIALTHLFAVTAGTTAGLRAEPAQHPHAGTAVAPHRRRPGRGG